MYALSCALVSAKGNLVDRASWSLWVLRLLGDQRNSSLVTLSWRNSDGLFYISFLSYFLLYVFLSSRTLSLTKPAYWSEVSRNSNSTAVEAYLAGVDVGQVERITRESDTST